MAKWSVIVALAPLTWVAAPTGCTQSGRDFPGTSAGDTAGADGADAAPEVSGDDVAADTIVADVADVATGLGCKVSETLFTPYCTRCHNQTKDFPNLNPGALEHLVGAEARAYPGRILVVAGDPTASLLYRKVHGPAADEGLRMPAYDGDTAAVEVPAEVQADLAAWIAAGAPACEGHEDPGPMPDATPLAGDAITFTTAPSGFQTTKPAWSDEGTCTASQWWKYSGNQDSASMHPGNACIDCHTKEREGPSYSYAGTVYPSIDEAADCRGVGGVKVEILGADDVVLGTTSSNSAGNFYIRNTTVPFEPFRARLTFEGRTREMKLVQASSGDCNTCHDADGNKGTLGRIVAP